jgi:serine/threonine-protein kinase HipA
MPRRSRRLGVWLHGRHVADIEEGRFPALRLRYTDEALATWPGNSPVVSCALPLSSRPAEARRFLRGVLPEGQALQTLAAEAGVAVTATFDLLDRYGRDIAGALVIAADEPTPRDHGIEPYDADGLAAAIDDLERHPLGAHDDSELSLAGLQDKLLLVDLGDGRWGRPLHGRPSTHILKVDPARHPGLVAAEAACLALAQALGLTTVDARLERIGDTDCLIVARFDRVVAPDGTVTRVHQEDLCQALDLDHEAAGGRGKYEAAGGPTFRQAARLLIDYAADPAAQLDRLVAYATFTVLIANADAHGKNLALLHPDAENVELAPLYDTVPTALWPKLRTAAAMSIARETDLAKLTLDDLVLEASWWPHPANRARRVATDTIERALAALDVVEHDAVRELVRARANALLSN